MKYDLEDYIVKFICALFVACVVYTTLTLHATNQDKVIRVPCYEDEQPLDCQQRLGDQFEVIYSAQIKKAWGEISL